MSSNEDSSRLPEVLCAGLACVDIELLDCEFPRTVEAITPFRSARYTPGGGAAQAARTLTALGVPAAAAYAAADDAHGRTLVDMLIEEHVQAHPALTEGCTPLAVLPVFDDGRRACFVTLGAASSINHRALVPDALLHAQLRAFHLGYPHLLRCIQGEELRDLFTRVKKLAPLAVISLDVNGAGDREDKACVLRPALSVVDVMHANLEEACTISGLNDPTIAADLHARDVSSLVEWFVHEGVRVMCITCGRDGVFAGTQLRSIEGTQEDFSVVYRRALSTSPGIVVNSSGAGDAFAAGALLGLLKIYARGDDSTSMTSDDLKFVADSGLASALFRLDPSVTVTDTSESIRQNDISGKPIPECLSIDHLLHKIANWPTIEPRAGFQ